MKKLLLFTLAILAISPLIFAGETNYVDKLAVKSCDSIVMTIDKGDYNRSYELSAKYFKNSLGSSDKWTEMLNTVRKPLGKSLSRELISSNSMNQVPGAPDGDYVQVKYKTSFENKKESVETVVVIKEDNKWKLDGYFIK